MSHPWPTLTDSYIGVVRHSVAGHVHEERRDLSEGRVGSPTPDDIGDPRRGFDGVRVLPDALNEPTGLHKPTVRVPVPFPVALDLVRPIPAVRSVNPLTVVRTSVPETPIDEHCHSLATEDDVRSAVDFGQRPCVYPVAQSHCVQRASESEFRYCVFPRQRLHPPSDLRRGSERLAAPLRHSLNVPPCEPHTSAATARLRQGCCDIGARTLPSDASTERAKQSRGSQP